MKKLVLAATLLAATAIAAPAQAASIVGLYNTGVDANGNKITAVDQTDTHYLVNGNTTFTTNNGAYIPDPNAQYIASAPGGQGGSQTYTLTFNLGAVPVSSAVLSGKVSYDNLINVYLNDTLLYSDQDHGPSGQGTFPAFQTLHSFSATGTAFQAGQNVLRFEVTDLGQPTGLLVTDLSGSAVPEPATWAMMLLGFGMVGFGLRTRRAGKVSTRVAFG